MPDITFRLARQNEYPGLAQWLVRICEDPENHCMHSWSGEETPPIEVILVESYEPTGPMSAKSVGEIGINAPIPTIANAITDAVGVRLTKTPFTPERVFVAMRASNG